MAMSLAALEILEKAQMPPAHARAITRAIEADATMRQGELATKGDLVVLRQDFSELRQGFSELRQGFSELGHDFSELRHTTQADIAELRHALKGDITETTSELRVEMREQKSEMMRWMLLTLMAQSSVTAGIMYFLLNLSR